MKLFLVVPLFVCSLVSIATAADDNKQSPEDIFRRFMIASLNHDADSIKATILPNKDSEILWQGNPPPKEIKEQVAKSLDDLKLVPIKEGEKVTLPDGKELVVGKEMVGDKKMFVWVEIQGSRLPTPFSMEKTAEGWRIDATPLIEARKATKNAMEQKTPVAPNK